MRLQIEFLSSPSQIIPFDHQPVLVGVINKWLGAHNEWHGVSSLYSFSRLNGGRAVKRLNGLIFDNGASMFFSSHDPKIVKRVLGNILEDPMAFNGLVVRDVTVIEDPDLSQRDIFYPGSPILLKEQQDNGCIQHLIYSDPLSSECLTNKFRAKLSSVGIDDPSVQLSFASDLGTSKTMLVSYKGVKNRASWCPIRIDASPESKLLAWNTGLGNSTGIGFGAIK